MVFLLAYNYTQRSRPKYIPLCHGRNVNGHGDFLASWLDEDMVTEQAGLETQWVVMRCYAQEIMI
jgi:hypothetical protein